MTDSLSTMELESLELSKAFHTTQKRIRNLPWVSGQRMFFEKYLNFVLKYMYECGFARTECNGIGLMEQFIDLNVTGISSDIYYVLEGVVNQYALNFMVTVPPEVDDLHFSWQALTKRAVSPGLGS